MAQDYNFVDITDNVVLQGNMPSSEFGPKSVKTSPTTYNKISSLDYTKIIAAVTEGAAEITVNYLQLPDQMVVKGEDGKPIMLTSDMIKRFVSNSVAKSMNGSISEVLEMASKTIEETSEEINDEERVNIEENAEVKDGEGNVDEDITFNFDGIELPEEETQVEAEEEQQPEDEVVEEIPKTDETPVEDVSEGNIVEETEIPVQPAYNGDSNINQNINVLMSFKGLMDEYEQAKENKRKQQEELFAQISDVEKEIDEIRQNQKTAIDQCREAYNAAKPTLEQLQIDLQAQFGIDLNMLGIQEESAEIQQEETQDNGYKM